MNMHPVRIGLILREDPLLLEGVVKVCNILEEMSDREFKKRDVNETLSLKYHILHYYLKDVAKQVETHLRIFRRFFLQHFSNFSPAQSSSVSNKSFLADSWK